MLSLCKESRAMLLVMIQASTLDVGFSGFSVGEWRAGGRVENGAWGVGVKVCSVVAVGGRAI